MNELQIFNNPEFGQVRTITESDRVLFCASDIAKALGYARPADAVNQHCPHTVKHSIGVKTGHKSDGTNATQIIDINFIPEGDVYRLIIRSKLPSAEKFERWVFDEVLPSIREHGMYATSSTIETMLSDPDMAIRLFTELKTEREKRMEREKKIEADKPKVVFADAVAVSHTTILVRELAKIITQNGYNIGEKRLFAYLRAKGYLVKRKGADYNSPTQKSMDLGLFWMKETTITHSNYTEIKKTPRITGKGQIYFINHFKQLMGGDVA